MIGLQFGQFHVIRQLGEGGMGAVYLAEHVVLHKQRAIKVLHQEWTKNPQVVQRFINEARAAASLEHRNLITVHDFGQLPDTNTWFMVMDYLDGGTLGQLIGAQPGALSPQLAIKIIAQIANGLDAAHRRGIIHRDLKPDNVYLISREGNEHHAVILDFGVAKLTEQNAGTMTHTNAVIGTPAYMATEQLRGAQIDLRADVFALGVIAYQMITGGWFPYQSGNTDDDYYQLTPAELYHRQMTQLPIDPRRHLAGVAEAWARVNLRALDRDPANRHDSAGAFAVALAETVPGDGAQPSGIQIVDAYARELRGSAPHEVVSPAKPASIPPATAGRYRLGDKLGEGGMAQVFLATASGAEGVSLPVAVKRVLPGLSDISAFATMFVQEARIASRLRHPNIVQVLDFDRDADSRLFLAMEFVDGKDLAAVLDNGAVPVPVAIFVATEMLRALGYAHEVPNAESGSRGVIHRDVSPQNVLVSWEGAVKVNDFGLAKVRDASSIGHSATLKGKPHFMSPEQANGEQLDGRSDLWAVGVMLWEMVSGRQLFRGTWKEVIAQVMFKPLEMPREAPADLAAVIAKLLARERDDRYATAEHVIADLAGCADNPRDGRGELVRLLGNRFPLEVRRHQQRPAEPRVAMMLIAASSPNTVVPAAPAEAMPVPKVSRLRSTAISIGAVVLVGGAAAAAALALRTHGTSGAAPPASDAPGASPPVQHVAMAVTPMDAAVAQSKPPAPDATIDAGIATAAVVDAGVADAAVAGAAAKPAPHPVVAKGELVVTVQATYAEIYVDGVDVGTTPLHASIAVGRHRVMGVNADLHRSETTIVTISTSQPTLIQEPW